MTTITIRLLFEALHCWPDCNIPEVSFLSKPHRHMFHIEGELPVTHDNRDTEFIKLRREVADYLAARYPDNNLGSMSCEMLAGELLHVFGFCRCAVFEDGENGATVYDFDALADAPPTDTYTDPSKYSRRSWTGLEVEGRLKGVSTLFLTSLANATTTPLPHIFLCPTVAQNEDPEALEAYVYAMVRSGKVVTVAVRPKDANKLTPWVRVNAHVMVDIALDGLTWLKPTDTVKVELAPYTTLSCSVEQMVATSPSDYKNDSTL